MRAEPSVSSISRLLVGAAIIAAVCYIAWRVRSIAVTVLLAAVIAAALEPFVSRICRYRIRALHPRSQRLAATTLVFVVAACVVIAATIWMAGPFGVEMKRLGSHLDLSQDAIKGFTTDLEAAYAGLPPLVKKLLANWNPAAVNERIGHFVTAVVAHGRGVVTHLWEVFIIPVLAFYFVTDSQSLKKYFVSFFPRRRRREVMYILRDGSDMFRNYIVGQLILCLIAGVFMAALLSYLRVKYALTLAGLAGITRAVPIVGPIASGIAIVGVIMASNFALAVKVLVIFTILHFVESKILMPVLIGERMRLHPALLLISILVGYEFFGILGMFLAAPVTALARTLVQRYYLEPRDARSRAPRECGPGAGQTTASPTGEGTCGVLSPSAT